MFYLQRVRPIAVAIHPNLVEELKERQKLIEEAGGKKALGGMTTFSEMAAYELKLMRMTSKDILDEITAVKTRENMYIQKFVVNGVQREFVPYELLKKLYILTSALRLRKDQPHIQLEVHKVKGMQKNEIKYLW